MPKLDTNRRRPAAIGLSALIVLLASLTLAACGSSSSTASSSTASKTTGTQAGTTTGNRAAFAGRFKALRECMQKNGVTLPNRTPGQGAGGGGAGGTGGALGGAGGTPPPGVSQSTYEAAVKKCAGLRPKGFGGANSSSPAVKQAVAKFATCMRENGVTLPTPNTSGSGPIFNTTGLNTAGAKFKAAQSKCASVLHGVLPTNPAG